MRRVKGLKEPRSKEEDRMLTIMYLPRWCGDDGVNVGKPPRLFCKGLLTPLAQVPVREEDSRLLSTLELGLDMEPMTAGRWRGQAPCRRDRGQEQHHPDQQPCRFAAQLFVIIGAAVFSSSFPTRGKSLKFRNSSLAGVVSDSNIVPGVSQRGRCGQATVQHQFKLGASTTN